MGRGLDGGEEKDGRSGREGGALVVGGLASGKRSAMDGGGCGGQCEGEAQ